MKKLLILGGTNFIGRNIVESLLSLDGFDITLFNRGISHPDLFEEVRHIPGDRNKEEDVKKVMSKRWDFIVDVSCYYPIQMDYVIQNCKGELQNYILISTCSVYQHDIDQESFRSEESPILDCTEEQAIDQSVASYGNRKAECERRLIHSGLPFTILRLPLTYGPYDYTDRLFYWLYQMNQEEGMVLLPERGRRVFSMTYVKDVVNTIDYLLKHKSQNKVYNCVSTMQSSISDIVRICHSIFDKKVTFVNVPASLLFANGVEEWTDIPLWLNTDKHIYSNQKLLSALGLKTTSLEAGISETISSLDADDFPLPKVGISNSLKEQLIKSHNKSGS